MKHGLLDTALLPQMLYRALNGSDDLVVILEQTGDATDDLLIAASNDAFCRAANADFAELIGKPFLGLAAPEADPATCLALLRAAHERCSFRSELLCSRQRGPPFWLGLHLMPVPQSVPPCSLILGRDITEGRRDRQQHAAIQGLLAKVFVSVQAAVAIADEDGAILMNNPALDHLLGYPVGGLVGHTAQEVVAPEFHAAVAAARARQSSVGQSLRLKAELLHIDGSRVPVEIAATMVQRDDLKRFRITTFTPAAKSAVAKVLVAGKIKLIGLEDVKASLGDRWPAVAARAMSSAEHVIRRRCGTHDTWSRTADSGFLICFGEATEDEAAFRASAIAREIRSRLIGEGESPAAAQVSAVTAAVDMPDSAGQTQDMIAAAIMQRLNAQLAEIERRARDCLAEAMHSASCELTAIHSRHLSEIVGHLAALSSDLERRIQSALVALPPREAQAFDFDRLMLRLAATQVVSAIGAGDRRPVLVPIDFEVFLDRRCGERYVAACQELDERLRPQLILVLTRLPHGVPKNRVLECVMRISPFCHKVGFEAMELDLPPVEFALLSGSMVIVRQEALNRWDQDDLAKFGRLVSTVHTARGRVLVRQVGSWDNARRLLKLGADLISVVVH
jgi:PAS domain S-box-containing protein